MNLQIELDTVADIIDFDSKNHRNRFHDMANCLELKSEAIRLLRCTKYDDIMVAIDNKIASIDVEIRWYAERLDRNCLRYEEMLEDFIQEHGKDYHPERRGPNGKTWVPDWQTSLDLDNYDKPETDEDPKYRENMAETSGDELTKADYINRYDMEDDR